MAAPRQTPLTCSGHTRPVVDLAFSEITPDGFFVISACKDGKPMIRNGMTGDWVGTFLGHKGAVWGVALNKTAEKAATGSADFTAKVWDAITGDELHSFSHPHIVKSVAFAEDKNWLLTGCNDKKVRLFDLDNPENVKIFEGHKTSIKKSIFSKDAKFIFSGGDDKALRIWNIQDGTMKEVPVTAAITSLQLVKDGTQILLTYGKVVSFWDANTHEVLKSFEMQSPVYAASLHPKGETFVWGGEDNYLHVCSAETGQQSDEYKGHFGPVHCVSYSPDGEVYASGSEDGTVRLWQTNVGSEYGLWRFTKEAAPASE